MIHPKKKMPVIPQELLNRPQPRGLLTAQKLLNEIGERQQQSNVDSVEILLTHRKVLSGLKDMADLGLYEELKGGLSEFICIADRALIAARGE